MDTSIESQGDPLPDEYTRARQEWDQIQPLPILNLCGNIIPNPVESNEPMLSRDIKPDMPSYERPLDPSLISMEQMEDYILKIDLSEDLPKIRTSNRGSSKRKSSLMTD